MLDDASLFRRYLLGELDESEREAFERKLMTNDEHFQELLIAEDDLVDDYCAGKLDASEEQHYRHRFLVTRERLRQHRFGAALKKHVAVAAAEETPAVLTKPGLFPRTWKLSFAAAAVVALIVAAVWLVRESQPTPVPLEPAAGGVEGSTVAFFLSSGSLRSLQSEADATIIVPDGVALVELQLDLPAEPRGDFDVTLEDAGSDAILAEGTLPARVIEGQWVVVAPVPAELLAPGAYRVVLREATADSAVLETFAFRVTGQ